MNVINTIGIITVFFILIALLLLFGGTMVGATLSAGMPGNGVMVANSSMWIPILLVFGLGGALAWVVFVQKK